MASVPRIGYRVWCCITSERPDALQAIKFENAPLDFGSCEYDSRLGRWLDIGTRRSV